MRQFGELTFEEYRTYDDLSKLSRIGPNIMPFQTMTPIRALSMLLLSLVLSQCSSSPPDVLAPDRVLHNGKIVTVDGDFSIAQAVAIKDGHFLAVGSNSEILSLAGAATEIFDLEGKTVLPGLHDSHVHLAQRVADPPEPLIAKFSQARSIQEIVEVVRQKVEATPPGKLVWLPRGPSVNRIEEKRWPTRHDLDPVSPDHPVILTFAGDYVNVANSAFLKAARIDRNVYQPYKDGLFGEFKVDRRGEPNGSGDWEGRSSHSEGGKISERLGCGPIGEKHCRGSGERHCPCRHHQPVGPLNGHQQCSHSPRL